MYTRMCTHTHTHAHTHAQVHFLPVCVGHTYKQQLQTTTADNKCSFSLHSHAVCHPATVHIDLMVDFTSCHLTRHTHRQPSTSTCPVVGESYTCTVIRSLLEVLQTCQCILCPVTWTTGAMLSSAELSRCSGTNILSMNSSFRATTSLG